MDIVKILFLGTSNGSGTDPGNFHSNLLITYKNETLLIDCGTDLEKSLRAAHRTECNVQNLYITHTDPDHCGDVERLMSIKYAKRQKMTLYMATDVYLRLLKRFNHVKTVSEPERFYECFKFQHCKTGFYLGGMRCELIKTLHDKETELYSYGLFITAGRIKILFTSDTQFNPKLFDQYYRSATVIFHDCAIGEKNPRHAHISELTTLPEEIKEKMYLYHYGIGEKPDASELGFAKYVYPGQPMYV